MDEETIRQILLNNSDYFITSDMIRSAFRWLGWQIVTFLKWLVEQCQNLYNASFGLVDFTTWGSVGLFIEEFRPVFVALLCISVFFLGILYIVGYEKKPNLMQITRNLMLSMFFMCAATILLTDLNSILMAGKDAVMATYAEDGNYANEIINSELIDLMYNDRTMENGLADISQENIRHYPSLSDEDFKMINYSEVIDYENDALSENGKDILAKQLTYAYEEDAKLVEINNGIFGITMLGNCYYRYKFNFMTPIITLIAFLIIYIIMSYKVVRYIWEIVMGHMLGVFQAANITNSQKLLKIIDCIKDMYLMLLMSTIFLKFFFLAQQYISEKFAGQSFVRSMLILFVAFCVADGPNIIEKVTGIDAGLKDGVGKMNAIFHAVSGAAHLAGGLTSMAVASYRQHQTLDAINDMNQQMQQMNNQSSESDHNNQNQNNSSMNQQGESYQNGMPNSQNQNSENGDYHENSQESPSPNDSEDIKDHDGGVHNNDINDQNHMDTEISDGSQKDMKSDMSDNRDNMTNAAMDDYVESHMGIEDTKNDDMYYSGVDMGLSSMYYEGSVLQQKDVMADDKKDMSHQLEKNSNKKEKE